MIEAVLFDLDNTLIDFTLMKRKACEAAIRAMIKAGLKAGKPKAMEELYYIYSRKGIEHQKVFQELIRRINGKEDHGLLAEGVVAYRKAKHAYARPFPKAKQTLGKLKAMGIKLGIVSDAPGIQAWTRLVETGLKPYFDVVVTFHDTGEAKPSPLPFRKALKQIRSRPSNVLFIGDWIDKDIKGAGALGMKTAFAKYGARTDFGKAGKTAPYRPSQSGADYDLEDISELVGIVRKEDAK